MSVTNENTNYPDYTAFLDVLDNGQFTVEILQKIIEKHRYNREHTKELFERYKCSSDGVPIFKRKPRFEEDSNAINNKVNNDFFSEINDFKIGYFSGKPFAYSYSTTDESESVTGGDDAIEQASKVLTDFIVRTNMYDVDMETTKHASVCGYAGRLFYIDKDGNERVTTIPAYETIVLSHRSVVEPDYGIRYYKTTDINDKELWKVEFYDNQTIKYYEGGLSSLKFVKEEDHLFDFCPLQIIPNNDEMLGDAEKVIALIDAYDTIFSDSVNEIVSFSNAYMVFENINATDAEIQKSQKTGAIRFHNGTNNGKVYFLTKDNTNSFNQAHLDRTEDNIYRFSKTPNLNDETFGSASGISLKFKLTGLETKCGMFQAKLSSGIQYMFKVLASSWAKKRIVFDPLQVVVDFKRNFPLDVVSEATAAQSLKSIGLPDEIVFGQLSFIDDVQYVMDLIEKEKNDIEPLEIGEDEENADENGNA